MRILFLVTGNGSRSNFVTGELMRYGEAGLSGTDTSVILVAEYLASQGYDIVIGVEKSSEDLIKQREARGFTFTPGEKVNGVTYTYLDLEGIEDRTFDILINCLWYGDYDKLPATITKAVCYWCHLAWVYYLNELKEYAQKHNLKVGYINISKWAEGHHQGNIDFLKEYFPDLETSILPNPMTTDVMQEVLDKKLERKHKKVIFPAQWSRGGDVAIKAVKELGWEADFMSFDYVNLAKGIDKQTLFTELSTSDYFIFPQYTNENVFKDVHSCAVGEAIGMGVVVVSYPLGSHEEHYGGHYIKLDFPPGIDMEKMITERVTHEPKMDYTENIVRTVKFLEDNPSIKEHMREKGTQYIFNNFHIDKIGPMWIEFLNKFEKKDNPFDFFDKIYYINLDSRTDRKIALEEKLSKLGIKAERFPAITLTREQNEQMIDDGCEFKEERPMHSLYTKSCALSHLSAILRAKLMQYNNVLILEDDVEFHENILEELTLSINDLKKQESWDMFYIGCNPASYKKVTNNLARSVFSFTAHAYAVNNHFYDRILNIPFKTMPCIDVSYGILSRDYNSNVFMALKNLAWQSAGYSTLEETDVDYLPSIQARYDTNLIEKSSISDYDKYKNACQNAADNDEAFNVFKTNPDYTTILEHTSYEQGIGYIEYINNTKLDLTKLALLKSNDLQGFAILEQFEDPYGLISPSTLRYIKVLAELEEMFGSLDGKHIVEIGSGYGGQCKIINEYFKPASYTLVDLPESLALAKRYLRDSNYEGIFYYKQKDLPEGKKYDLLISNYAFSECERSIQLKYIDQIFNNSTNGYVTFNNISNIFNVDSLSREEFKKTFPCSEKQEVPLTGDNNIYYW